MLQVFHVQLFNIKGIRLQQKGCCVKPLPTREKQIWALGSERAFGLKTEKLSALRFARGHALADSSSLTHYEGA